MEKDDEITGVTGSHLDFGARIHDARIGRFLSIDPLYSKYPYQSPYCFAGNNPIRFIDILGMGPGEGPFSGRGYKTNFGVRIFRITTNDRISMNLSKQLFYTLGGPVGTICSTMEDVATFVDDPLGSIGSLLYTGGSEGAIYAADKLSKDVVVGDNRSFFKSASNKMSKGKKGIGLAMAIINAATTESTRNEILEETTFEYAKKALGGDLNYSNKGLFDIHNKDMSVEKVEQTMNIIYNTLDEFLKDYDLTTEDGMKNANEYMKTNNQDFFKKLGENRTKAKENEGS